MSGPADHYQRLTELLAFPALLVQADGTVLGSNRAARTELGLAATGRPRLEDWVSDAAEKTAGYLKLCSRSRQPVPGSLTFRTPGGKQATYRCEGALLEPRAGGSPALLLLQLAPRQGTPSAFVRLTEKIDELNRQIAQRKMAEQALHRSQDRMAGIVDSAMDAIITVDAGQRVTVFNRAAEKIFRCAAGEALGQPLDRFIPPRYQEAHREHIRTFGKTGTTSRSMYSPGTLTGVRADGEEFPLEASISQIETGGQKLFTVILRDITERKQAEEALRKSAERLQVAQRAAGIGTWEWDLRSGKIYWSEEVPALHGLPAMSFEGDEKEWLKLAVHPDDREYVQDAIQKALSGEAEYDVEFRTVWPDDSLHWVAARAQVFRNGQGEPERMVGIGMDVTGRKQAEETMRTTEKLAAAGRLAATISHEINNPLEAVTNLLYLLEKHSTLDGQGQEYARLAQAELARVAHMARQTLAFYRETASPAPVELPALVQEVVDLLGVRLRNREITIEYAAEPAPHIMAFASELRQVVSNLLVNAVDAVEPGDRVRVRVRASRNWARPEVTGVRLVIADNGSGIQPEHRKIIFEPFFTTKGERGTGLGLWVTHGIILKHGGSIVMRSSVQPGRSGTVFSVFLPLESAGTQAAGQGLVTQTA